jgi:C4-dicarboxylate-specific signal transduction histidine kinase
MKTIKLKLTVQDQSNPVLVDDENNVVIGSSRMAWVVQKGGKMISAPAALLAEHMGEIVNVQADASGKPVMLNDKAIIVL